MSTEFLFFLCHVILIYIQLSLACHKSCDICLSSSDFKEGTYRIIASGKYCIDEDIEFNPLKGKITNPNDPNTEKNWFPKDVKKYPGCDTNKNGAFGLGFFAALVIETDDVEIDLEKHAISQHLHHYLQQRFFSIIEIGKAPFITGSGPTNFGKLSSIKNIFIHNGKLSLSSHHGIHSNEAHKVRIEDLKILNFEVGAIQFNGFSDITMKNIEIGPSAQNVKSSGYYSNAKFLSFPLYKLTKSLDKASKTYITFHGDRKLSIQEIYENLIISMDLAFRHFIDESSKEDIKHSLYSQSIELYSNSDELPDGSALYGILLHSHDLAVNGYGDKRNGKGDGEDVVIQNVHIHDLMLRLNEVPAVYFDKCIHKKSKKTTVLKGPFGDVMDLRKMVGDDGDIIDDGKDYTELYYVGNPLSDAQIALALYGDEYDIGHGVKGFDKHSVFLRWALDEYRGDSYDTLPECTSFMCNSDIMLHTNKGVIGIRADKIEDVIINGVVIKYLINKSDLASYACHDYTGSENGGNPHQLELEGSMGTDVKGITIYAGDMTLRGDDNTIEYLTSYNGDAVGIHLMDDAQLYIDRDDGKLVIDEDTLKTGEKISKTELKELIKQNKSPYPNNFYTCNILKDLNDKVNIKIDPNPPNGIDRIECRDYEGHRITDLKKSNTLDRNSESNDDY